jgi:hypothetical protein
MCPWGRVRVWILNHVAGIVAVVIVDGVDVVVAVADASAMVY